MTEKDTANLIKLDGKNYEMWKFGITFLLDAKELSEFVEGADEEPDKAKNLNEWKMWRKSRSQAAVILLTSVEQALHPNLINCSSPQAIWDKLKALYGEVSEDAAASAWQQYYDFKIDDNEPVNVQIEKFESIYKKLENIGEKVSEMSVISKLLSSLTPRFSAFRMAWECTPKDAQKIENLTVRIIREDKRLKEDHESETTLALQVQAMNLKKQEPKREYLTKAQIQELKKRTRCKICKKIGHWMRECPDNVFEDDGKQGVKNDDLKTMETYICEVSALSSETTCKEKDIWIADSGASMHMAWERESFTTLQPSEEITFVRIADNKILHTAGIGTVDIQVTLEGQVYDRQLTNVLLVPDLRRNLFSVGVVNNKNYSFHAYNDRCEIRNPKGELSLVGTRYGNLFRMLFKVKKQMECNIVSVNVASLKLWHERLGHINIRSIKETERFMAVEGLKLAFNNFEDFFCEPCTLGKQTRKPHKSIARNRNFKPGEMIHTDVCGPVNIESPKGTRYFVLFKDECTGYRAAYFLRQKSETFDQFRKFESLIMRQTGNKLKVLRSDNGTEYLSTQFKKFINDKGIVHELSSPYIHEQNGRAEREIRTIVDNARSMMIAKNVPKQLWPEAVNSAIYLLNRVVTKQSNGKTAYESWFNCKPNVSHLRVFGSDAYLSIPKEKRTKFDEKSRKMIMVGYDGESQNYRLWDKESRKIYVSSDVVFNEKEDENIIPNDETRKTFDLSLAPIEEEEENEDKAAENENNRNDEDQHGENNEDQHGENDGDQHEDNEENQENRTNYAHRLRERTRLNRPNYYGVPVAYTVDTAPVSYTEAIKSPESEKWIKAMSEKCVFIATIDGNLVYLALYVDDGLMASKSKSVINKVLQYLKTIFQITVDEADQFVGFEIQRNREKRLLKIKQSNYVRKILNKFMMEEANPVGIPAEPGLHLSATTIVGQKNHNEYIPYREAVGSLLFAARVTRPDIEYAVNTVSQFLNNFNETHWSAVKKIFRYLRGTIDYGIVYGASGRETPELVKDIGASGRQLELEGYTDADFAGCVDTRKSRSGFVFMLNKSPVSWCSKRQDIVSLSTTEAEYIALNHGAKDAVWLQKILKELDVKCKSVIVQVDNQSAIKLASNPELHNRSKHIDVRYHYIRDLVEDETIKIKYVQSKEQVADIFTKPLPKEQFVYLRNKLSMSDRI